MLHYTINTAHTFDCSTKQYEPKVFQLLKPLAARAIAEGQTQTSLPKPLNNFSVKISVEDEAALFDVLDQEGLPITVNAIAWTEVGQSSIWDRFESFYLKLSREFDTLSVSRAPVCPDSIPWLATLIVPNPRGQSPWLADFEQCLALTIIRESKPKKQGGKGFGRFT